MLNGLSGATREVKLSEVGLADKQTYHKSRTNRRATTSAARVTELARDQAAS